MNAHAQCVREVARHHYVENSPTRLQVEAAADEIERLEQENVQLRQSFESQRNNYILLYESVLGCEGATTADFKDICAVASRQREENVKLREQMEDMEKDKARLDWVQLNLPIIHSFASGRFRVYDYGAFHRFDSQHSNLRTAIEIAIEQNKQSK